MRLIAFPYAGGSAAIYRRLPKYLPSLEVHAVELPGRGRRLLETPYTSMPKLIDMLLGELSDPLHSPFAFFGHSMGATIAYELACALPPEVRPNLKHLFVSARRAPTVPPALELLHTLDNDALKDRLRELGGTAQAVLDSHDLMNMLLPMVRADFTLVETHRATQQCLPVDITAFVGLQDMGATPDHMRGWSQATSKSFELKAFEGGHFFLEAALPVVGEVVLRRLEK